MRIYTRYKAVKRNRLWHGALRLVLAVAGLGLIGYVIYRHAEPQLVRTLASDIIPGKTENRLAPSLPSSLVPTPRASAAAQAPSTNAVESPPTPIPARTNLPPPSPLLIPPPTVTPPDVVPSPAPPPASDRPRPVENILEAQIALARRGISSGSIDGAVGYQTRAALRAFQGLERLRQTGALDDATRARLILDPPALTNVIVASNDLARLRPVPPTWLGKSQQPRLDYSTILELIAERHRAHPGLLRQLNPTVPWTNVVAGQSLVVPSVPTPVLPGRLAFLRIRLQDRVLAGYDLRTNLLLHFPCSIAARLEKRPLGRLEVVVIAQDPAYTFNPAVFPESAEGRRLGRKLTIPPGPNNPVGVAWIGLSRSGYGIHGTPRPEAVGRTESHGCFRLANWDAELLIQLVWRGLPVYVQH